MCDSVTYPEALLWLSVLSSIKCEAGSILLLHEDTLPRFQALALLSGKLAKACLEDKGIAESRTSATNKG